MDLKKILTILTFYFLVFARCRCKFYCKISKVCIVCASAIFCNIMHWFHFYLSICLFNYPYFRQYIFPSMYTYICSSIHLHMCRSNFPMSHPARRLVRWLINLSLFPQKLLRTHKLKSLQDLYLSICLFFSHFPSFICQTVFLIVFHYACLNLTLGSASGGPGTTRDILSINDQRSLGRILNSIVMK